MLENIPSPTELLYQWLSSFPYNTTNQYLLIFLADLGVFSLLFIFMVLNKEAEEVIDQEEGED